MGRRRWGEDLIGGFSSPHTLLPKEEKEEKSTYFWFELQEGCRQELMGIIFQKRFKKEKNCV